MSKIYFNERAVMRNHSLVTKAEQLINNFLNDDESIVFATNPDGTIMELKKGVTFTSINYVVNKEAKNDS